MSEFRVTLRPALKHVSPLISERISLEALPEGHVVHVLGKPDGDDLGARLDPLSDGTAHAVRAIGPGQWFIVGNGVKSDEALAAINDTLAPEACGIDQSHGRVRMRASGPKVERMLAKGTAVDLSISEFPLGRTTGTLIGHIGAHITRVGDDAFEIMVLRGFAESLWDDLVRMCAEYA